MTRLLVAASCLALAPISGQQATFRSTTAMVSVSVSVKRGNAIVANLEASDFTLTDNGVRQTVEAVSMESVPVDVTLFLDTSGSTAGKLDEMQHDVQSILQLLRSGDRFRLLTIGDTVNQVVPWVPLTQEEYGWLTSARVVELAVDASIGVPGPALDNIRLMPGPAPPSPSGSSPEVPASSIPDGVYRVTLTLDDIVRAGGANDDNEDTGTFTIVMVGGRFIWHQRGDVPINNPIGVGTYEGAGNGIRFRVEQPYFNAGSLSPVTWRLDGDNLVFALARCTGPAAQDPPFCGFQKALFGAHPWERVTEFSGGPF